MFKYLLLTLTLTMVGCQSTQPISEYSQADAGQVIMGISAAPKTYYGSMGFYVRGLDNDFKKKFIYSTSNGFLAVKHDYKTENESGFIIQHSFPPGKYEVYNFYLFYNSGTATTDFTSRQEFSIEFQVLPNQTTYLGNFLAHQVMAKNILGIPVPAGAEFEVRDLEKADLSIYDRKYPGTKSNKINNQVNSFLNTGLPFFRN